MSSMLKSAEERDALGSQREARNLPSPHAPLSAPNGKIPQLDSYSVGQLALILGVAGTTVRGMIDSGLLSGYWLPGRRQRRRVRHEALVRFVIIHPRFRHILERLDCEPIEFPQATEPAPTAQAFVPPRSPERPRRARYGKIPASPFYTLQECGFLLGLSRRTVLDWVRAKKLGGIHRPSPPHTRRIHPWSWGVSHQSLIHFIRGNPHYKFALARIETEPTAHSPTPQRG
jgi:hypothetical protein